MHGNFYDACFLFLPQWKQQTEMQSAERFFPRVRVGFGYTEKEGCFKDIIRFFSITEETHDENKMV